MTRVEELHDLYCPNVGLGCNMNEPKEVEKCPFFRVIKETVAAERAHLVRKIEDEQRFLTTGDKDLLIRMIRGDE